MVIDEDKWRQYGEAAELNIEIYWLYLRDRNHKYVFLFQFRYYNKLWYTNQVLLQALLSKKSVYFWAASRCIRTSKIKNLYSRNIEKLL